MIKAAKRQFIAAIVFNILFMILHLGFLVVGLIYLFNDAECDRPLALFAFIYGLTSIPSQVFSSTIPLIRGATDDKDRDKTVKTIGGVIGLFVLVWFIIFNVQTFGAKVCDTFLRDFCFWGIWSVYILVALAITVMCCLMCTAFKGL
ncbi:hypothetical protein P9112_005498 [Eukaryota sp. TZLM1-RC]